MYVLFAMLYFIYLPLQPFHATDMSNQESSITVLSYIIAVLMRYFLLNFVELKLNYLMSI